MLANRKLRFSVKVPIGEVLARLSPHVLSDERAANTTPWPHYQGAIRDTVFDLIAPPRFGFTRFGLRKGPRYTRLPIAIVGTLAANDNETLVEANVGLTSRSWWLVIGLPLGVLLLMSAILYAIYPLNHALFVNLVGMTSGLTAVFGLLMSWLSLQLDKQDFQNVLQGHARK